MINQFNICSDRKNPQTFSSFASKSFGTIDWLLGIFYPFLNTGTTKDWINYQNLSHIGYITIFLSIGFIVNFFLNKNKIKTVRKSFVYTFLLLSIFALFCECNFIIPSILYLLPIFNKFRWLYKFQFFTSFYLVIVGVFGFNWFITTCLNLKGNQTRNVRTVSIVLVLLNIVNFYVLYLCFPQKAFGCHLDKVPFEEPLKDELSFQRIKSLGFNRATINQFGIYSTYKCTVPSMEGTYPTYFKIFSFDG